MKEQLSDFLPPHALARLHSLLLNLFSSPSASAAVKIRALSHTFSYRIEQNLTGKRIG